MSGRRIQGASLAEFLVAAGMLLLLTLVTGSVLVYAYSRGAKLDKRQERIQEYALFRERFSSLLINCRLTVADSGSDRLTFVNPSRLPTAVGHLDLVSSAEQTKWNEVDVYQITSETVDGNFLILNKKVLPALLPGESRPDQILWNLGRQPSSLEFDITQLPVLKTTVSSREDDTSPTWTRTIILVVENFV